MWGKAGIRPQPQASDTSMGQRPGWKIRLTSGPGPVRETSIRQNSGIAEQGHRDRNGLSRAHGWAGLWLSWRPASYGIVVGSYLHSATYTQGSCNKGVATAYVRYLQSASRCDIGPTVDRQMETGSDSLKYQVPLRSCVWAPAETS